MDALCYVKHLFAACHIGKQTIGALLDARSGQYFGLGADRERHMCGNEIDQQGRIGYVDNVQNHLRRSFSGLLDYLDSRIFYGADERHHLLVGHARLGLLDGLYGGLQCTMYGSHASHVEYLALAVGAHYSSGLVVGDFKHFHDLCYYSIVAELVGGKLHFRISLRHNSYIDVAVCCHFGQFAGKFAAEANGDCHSRKQYKVAGGEQWQMVEVGFGH